MCDLWNLQAGNGAAFKPSEVFFYTYPHAAPGDFRRGSRLPRCCKYIVIFPGKISGSIRMPVCRIDCRDDAVADA